VGPCHRRSDRQLTACQQYCALTPEATTCTGDCDNRGRACLAECDMPDPAAAAAVAPPVTEVTAPPEPPAEDIFGKKKVTKNKKKIAKKKAKK
jgi:hypothetical protein